MIDQVLIVGFDSLSSVMKQWHKNPPFHLSK
ncbi:hypothetical protein SAN_1057 [Streptococcus agalactiae COH1]|nr:hypothetical protein SAN_1057 [Streptococcus agalactiae COH1]